MVNTRKRRDPVPDDSDDDIDISDHDHNHDNDVSDHDHDNDVNVEHRDEATLKEKAAVISLLILIGTQIATKKIGVITPAFLLSNLTNHMISFFKSMGSKFVNFSIEVARYISIKELAMSVYDLFTPLFYLLMSPYNFIAGILEASVENAGVSTISIITTLVILLTVFVLAQRNVYDMFKPSVLFRNFSTFVSNCYLAIGAWFAAVSAIYRVLKLDRFVEDAIEISRPLLNLVVAPFEAINGYITALRESKYFSERTGSIVSGAGILLAGGLTLIGIYYYGFHISR